MMYLAAGARPLPVSGTHGSPRRQQAVADAWPNFPQIDEVEIPNPSRNRSQPVARRC